MNSPNRKRGRRSWIPSPPIVISLLMMAPFLLGASTDYYFRYLEYRDEQAVVRLLKRMAPPGADFTGLEVHSTAKCVSWQWKNHNIWSRTSFPIIASSIDRYRDNPDFYEKKSRHFRTKEFYTNEMYEFFINKTRDRLPDDGTLDYWDKLSKTQHISMVAELIKWYTPGKLYWDDADHIKYERELINKLVTEVQELAK